MYVSGELERLFSVTPFFNITSLHFTSVSVLASKLSLSARYHNFSLAQSGIVASHRWNVDRVASFLQLIFCHVIDPSSFSWYTLRITWTTWTLRKLSLPHNINPIYVYPSENIHLSYFTEKITIFYISYIRKTIEWFFLQNSKRI